MTLTLKVTSHILKDDKTVSVSLRSVWSFDNGSLEITMDANDAIQFPVGMQLILKEEKK